MDVLIGSVPNGRYRLDAEPGRGAMGIVFGARDLIVLAAWQAPQACQACLGPWAAVGRRGMQGLRC